MSGIPLLDWAALAISLFNTVVLTWLGLTVLLTAERRHAGIWLSGGGLLTGAVFFLSHTAILGLGLYDPLAGDFWWRVGWIPVILAPFAWYTVMLWYAGYWEECSNPIHKRHRVPLAAISAAALALLFLGVIASQIPSFGQVARFDPPAPVGPALLLFGVFIVACIGLSIDALLRPGPTERMMGGLARRRARPWLMAATLTLLLVSLLVSGVLGWAMAELQPGSRAEDRSLGGVVTGLDVLIAGLIGVSVLLTGQAIVVYEIFTGKALPRRGLRRYWRWAILLAGGYSAVIAIGLTWRLPVIYGLLFSAGLMILFYALLGYRSYGERQHLLAELRPFVYGPRLYDQMLTDRQPFSDDKSPELLREEAIHPQATLDLLRREVLHARRAALAPLGAAAPLFGSPLYSGSPETGGVDLKGWKDADPEVLTVLAAGLLHDTSPEELYRPVPGGTPGGWEWIVPLWNERGPCGALLLGPKLDDGLYTQEEIETARAAGERMIDLQAGAELARRLMALQRQQVAESQVVDRRTRRTLHDEVLPGLHAAMLTVEADPAAAAQMLSEVHRQIANLLHELPRATTSESARLGLVEALRQVLDEQFKAGFDAIEWQPSAEGLETAARLTPVQAETVFYAAREAVRNAARHARQGRPLHLRVALQGGPVLEVLVQDDGAGMGGGSAHGPESGQGLALHSTLLAVLGGSLSIEVYEGWSTTICIRLPV